MSKTRVDGTVVLPKLPTEEETEELYSAYGKALEHLQNRGFEIRTLLEAQDAGTTKVSTFEDIGRFYSLVENLKMDRWALGEEINNLEAHLHQLYVNRDETVEPS
jgi:hypothetical protein